MNWCVKEMGSSKAMLCIVISTEIAPHAFPRMLTEDFQDGDDVSPVTYGFDGKLFILRRLQIKSKVQKDMLDEFFLAKNASTAKQMQETMVPVSQA